MATTKKMTKREVFEQIKASYPLSAEHIAFIDHELELLAKKNSAEKKPTANQVANAGIKDAIYGEMADNMLYTVTDMCKGLTSCADMSNQKLSALLRQMVADGKVERVEDKRKAYFRKVC